MGSFAYQIVRALGLPLKFRILAGSKFSEVLSIVPLYCERIRPLQYVQYVHCTVNVLGH